jgi:hypothetical protein
MPQVGGVDAALERLPTFRRRFPLRLFLRGLSPTSALLSQVYFYHLDRFLIGFTLVISRFDGLPRRRFKPRSSLGGHSSGYRMEQIRDDRACENFVYALPWGWIAAG